MTSIGTRKFWKPIRLNSAESDSQVLKNAGYLSVVLHAVHYNVKGSFWQKTFGGSDRITLTSQITYLSGNSSICSVNVQNVSELEVERSYFLGVGRVVALKVPTSADGLELSVSIASLSSDNFQTALNFLNSDEFKKPLQLLPPLVGEIVTVTNIVKKIFGEDAKRKQINAVYPGVISDAPVSEPLQNNRLLAGYLILVAEADDDSRTLAGIKPDELEVQGDRVLHKGVALTSTYVVFNLSFETNRGIDVTANWTRKYKEALQNLDKLYIQTDAGKRKEILDDALQFWIGANSLLDADPSYVAHEANAIKASYLKKIQDKYSEATGQSLFTKMEKPALHSVSLQFARKEQPGDEASKLQTYVTSVSGSYLQDLGNAGRSFPVD